MGEIQRSTNNAIYTAGNAALNYRNTRSKEKQAAATAHSAGSLDRMETEWSLYSQGRGAPESVDNRNAKLLGDAHEPNWTVPDPNNVVEAQFEELPMKYEGTKSIGMDKDPKAITMDKSTKEIPYNWYHNYNIDKSMEAGKLLSQEEYGKLLEKQRQDRMNRLRDISMKLIKDPKYQSDTTLAKMNKKRFMNILSAVAKGTPLDPTLFINRLNIPRLYTDPEYDEMNRKILSHPDQYSEIYYTLLKEDPTLKQDLDNVRKPYQDPDEMKKILDNVYNKNEIEKKKEVKDDGE